MKFWERLSRKHKQISYDAQLTLTRAYRNVFFGNADRPQQQMVLADLGARCGWNQVLTPETAEQRIWFNEGRRAAYAVVFSHLSLSPEDVTALENAIRAEAATFSQNDY